MDKIAPPYTNRWRTRPGPNFRRCKFILRNGDQCRRGARKGHDNCDQHDPKRKTRD